MSDEDSFLEESLSEEETENDRVEIKEKLKNLSFEDLQKLKDKMGLKMYNKTVFGEKETKRKTSFKRANKNRPREMSSKRPIRINQNVSAKKPVARDPRFEPACGEFNRDTFKSNYKFINDLRKKEKKELEEQLKNTTDEAEKKRIKFVIQRLANQLKDEESKETEGPTATKKPKEHKPYFKKKSVQKLESLVEKYEKLKKTNKIQKHIERKAKKVTVRERKKLEKQNLI